MITAAEATETCREARRARQEAQRLLEEEKARTREEWRKELPFFLKELEESIRKEAAKGSSCIFIDVNRNSPREQYLQEQAVMSLAPLGYTASLDKYCSGQTCYFITWPQPEAPPKDEKKTSSWWRRLFTSKKDSL